MLTCDHPRVQPSTNKALHHQGQSTCKTSFMYVPPGSIHIQNFPHVHTTRVNPHTKLPSCPHHQGQPTCKTFFMSILPGSTHIQNFFHVCTIRVNPHAKLLSCLYHQGQSTCKTSFMSITMLNSNQKQVQTDQQYTHVNILDKRPLS